MDLPTDTIDWRLSAGPEFAPVPVTRWTARLADPQTERDYLLHRFADDRRRVLILTGLVAVASTLNFLVGYFTNVSWFAAALAPAIAASPCRSSASSSRCGCARRPCCR